MPKKLLLITPIFYSDVSGASIYYQMLTKYLNSYGFSVFVVSEEGINMSNEHNYYGLFPRRASAKRRIVKDCFSYFIQNIKYLSLSIIIRNVRPHFVLVHSSFYNHPGVFGVVMDKIINENSGCKFILDVRDRLMPQRKTKYLEKYFKIIACSQNVYNFLLKNGVPEEKLQLIPVIQEPVQVEHFQALSYIKELKLNVPYMLYVGLVKESKKVDLLLEAFVDYFSEINDEVSFVVVGTLKTQSRKILNMLRHPRVIYLNSRSRQEVLYLMYFSKLCVNISPNEGLPRASLEAIALKRPVLLPPNVPEFEKYCPKLVVKTQNPQQIANLFLKAYDNREYICNSYPIQQHYPNNVVAKYLKILT